MIKIIKILPILLLVALTSCKRDLEPIKKSFIFSKAQEDIKKIEEIKKIT